MPDTTNLGENNIQEKKSNFLSRFIITMIIVLVVAVGVGGYYLGSRQKNNVFSIDEKSSNTPTNPKNLTSEVTDNFTLDPLSSDTEYAWRYYVKEQNKLVITYNPNPKSIPPVDVISRSYPDLALANYYYHGKLSSDTFGLNMTFENISVWNVVSAVKKVESPGEVNSPYEKNLPVYSSLFGLLSNDAKQFILLDYISQGENPFFSEKGNVFTVDQNLQYYDLFNYEWNTWQTSYLNMRSFAESPGGNGREVFSDDSHRYELSYVPVLFENEYINQVQVDTIKGKPVYESANQTNVLPGYTKYFMRAENGFIYNLYKKN